MVSCSTPATVSPCCRRCSMSNFRLCPVFLIAAIGEDAGHLFREISRSHLETGWLPPAAPGTERSSPRWRRPAPRRRCSALKNSSAVVSMSQAKLPARLILAASSCSWAAFSSRCTGAAASFPAAPAAGSAPPIFFSRLSNLQAAVEFGQALVVARGRERRQLPAPCPPSGMQAKSSSCRQDANKCR